MDVTADVEVTREENSLWVRPLGKAIQSRKMWGTTRSLLSNMVIGVSEGFSRNLVIVGVGYRAAVQGKDLVLQLGFSHEARYSIPQGISIECPEQTRVSIKGVDKRQVGQVASEIRSLRPPEPYKGKGVKYSDEYILRKEGKKK
jgi:large subunit ribosomal protein L6